MTKIGFIGLGIMGRPMAGHLLAGDHQLFVHDHKDPPNELTDKGAVAAPDRSSRSSTAGAGPRNSASSWIWPRMRPRIRDSE